MNKYLKLVNGELKRLITYKILPVSLVTGLIWITILFFLSAVEARVIAPLFIFVDLSMMIILLIGASHHLEKQEGTIKTMMVMPVTLGQILIAKVAGSLVLGVQSVVLTCLALYLIHGITFNYGLLLLVTIIVAVVHSAIGFFLALNSRDFTFMRGWMMAYIFPFVIPTILFMFEIIPQKYEWLLMISPSHSGSNLIKYVTSGDFGIWQLIGSCAYLIILSGVLFRLAVYPTFKSHAVRG